MKIFVVRFAPDDSGAKRLSRVAVRVRGNGFLIRAEDPAYAQAVADEFVGVEVKTGEKLGTIHSVERATPEEAVRVPWIRDLRPFRLSQLKKLREAQLH